MQALDTLAAVYAVFEKVGENLNVENSEGDILYADVRAAMEEFNEPQQNQERVRGVLHDSPKKVSTMPSWNSKKHAAALIVIPMKYGTYKKLWT